MKPAGERIAAARAGRAPLRALLAICICVSPLSAQPAGAPAKQPQWFADAIAAARDSLRQLELMRIRPDATPEMVTEVVEKALTRLGKADRRLAQELSQLAGEAPAPLPRSKDPSRPLRRELHGRRCRVALLRGELYCAAALALPKDAKARRRYLDSAILTFRTLRVLYLDVPLAWMGYLGEAKAQRLAGRAEAADKALAAILDMPISPGDGAAAQLCRAAMLEKLEIRLASVPAKAVTEGRTWRKSPKLAGEPIWQARIDWVLGRALAAEAARLTGSGQPDAAGDALAGSLALLRSKPVAAVAAPYDRLALLARVDALAGGKVMTRAELLQWADALAATGSAAAADAYRRAESMPGGPLSADRQYAYARTLWQKGEPAAAAEACDALLKRVPSNHPRRPGAMKLRAVALLNLYRRTDAAKLPAGLPASLLSALQAVIEANLPEPVRRDALCQWAAVRSRRAGFDGCVGMLAKHPRLVAASPYLLYARAAGRWMLLSAETSAEQARRIVAECEAAQRAAERAAAGDLAARSALLRARALAAAPLGEPRAALRVLREASAALEADKTTAAAAAWLRAKMLLELGLTDEAEQAIKPLMSARAADSGGQSGVLLRLAEALAGRYAGADPAARGRVVRLCSRAMALAVGNERSYAATARRSARAMLKVGAHADARAILEKLLESKTTQSAPAGLDCALMLGEALQQGGEWNQAKARLERLAKQFPQSAAAHLALGRLEMAMKQPAVAVECFRRARKLCRRGSPHWCEGTLALAEGLHAKGDTVAASDVLRVSRALYPRFGSPELLARLKRLSERLKRGRIPAPSQGERGQ